MCERENVKKEVDMRELGGPRRRRASKECLEDLIQNLSMSENSFSVVNSHLIVKNFAIGCTESSRH